MTHRFRRWASLVTVLLLSYGCSAGGAVPASTSATTTTLGPPPSVAETTTVPGGAVSPSGFRTRLPGQLIVGTERIGAPWFTGPSAEVVTGGFDFAVAQEIGSRLGVPVVHVVKSSLVTLMTGQECGCDVMLGSITITDGRARILDLSEPYLASDQGVLTRKGTTLNSGSEGSLLRWGIAVRNLAGVLVLNERVKPIVDPTMVVNEDSGVRLLTEGRIDAMLLDLPDALARASADPTLTVIGQFRTGAQYAVALGVGSPNTAIINDVIRRMRDDGILTALLRTYLGAAPQDIPVIPG